MEMISGQTFRAIQVAVDELTKNGLTVENYNIIVEHDGRTIHISFEDPDRSPNQRGSTTKMRGFEVELEATTNKVIQSGFVR